MFGWFLVTISLATRFHEVLGVETTVAYQDTDCHGEYGNKRIKKSDFYTPVNHNLF